MKCKSILYQENYAMLICPHNLFQVYVNLVPHQVVTVCQIRTTFKSTLYRGDFVMSSWYHNPVQVYLNLLPHHVNHIK